MAFRVRQKVFDKGRGQRGEIVRVYPTGGLLKLCDGDGFEWLAASEQCSPVSRGRAPITIASPEPFRIPPGTIPYDNCHPSEIRIGDYAMFQGRAQLVRDLRGQGFGGGKTLIFDNGRARPAQPQERVFRPRTP
ncbi:hypothetical protein AB0O42_05540 [Streptomyces sp. NPDC089922]|uniref:hypothetical protein n=1 Tax=Streptomyces sp. NPDC089922 TaxID=3155189 RepID=UPI00342E32B8